MIRGADVFLLWRPWLGPFQLAFAEALKAEGARLHLYVSMPGQLPSVLARAPAGLFERHGVSGQLYDVAVQPAAPIEVEVARARAHETWLGLPYGYFAIGDRHLGRGYALGGAKFPTSAPSRATRAQTLAAFSSQIEYWRHEIDQHKPSLILEPGRVLDVVAAAAGVSTRLLAASRQANLYYWAHNYFLESPAIETAYADLQRQGLPAAPDLQLEQAHAVVSYHRTSMRAATLAHFARRAGMQIARRTWARLRGRKTDNVYDLSSNVAYLWRTRRHVRRMTGHGMLRADDLAGQRFAYFPLATEPELTLQGLSPEYFFQLEAIAALARDLPADCLLAIKEHHPACGAREANYYDKIAAFKNVVFLDMREHGPTVIRKADVTVTIAGSSGFEAAAMGKPTIVLGRHNICQFLPHVRLVRDIADLRIALDDALEGRLAGPKARLDGARLLEAMQAISFDMEAFDPFAKATGVSKDVVDSAMTMLRRSLAIEPDHPHSRRPAEATT